MSENEAHERSPEHAGAPAAADVAPHSDENPYSPPEVSVFPSRSTVIQRPTRMPGAVIGATVLICLLLLNFVASFFISGDGTVFRWPSASQASYWLPTFVTGVVLTGILTQHPAAWSVSRSLSVLGLLLVLFGLGCGAIVADRWYFLLAVLTLLPLAAVNVGIFLLLGRPVSRAWFGLGCPNCGLLYPRSAKFGYTLARCRECHTLWEPRTGNLKAS